MYNFKWEKYQQDPEYQAHIQRALGKIGESGKAILDTGYVDAAFANREAKNEMMFNDMAQKKKVQDETLAESDRRFNTSMSNAYRDLDAERRDLRTANMLDLGSLAVHGLGAYNDYKANKGLLAKYQDYIRSL